MVVASGEALIIEDEACLRGVQRAGEGTTNTHGEANQTGHGALCNLVM